jgi:hypothetical protein
VCVCVCVCVFAFDDEARYQQEGLVQGGTRGDEEGRASNMSSQLSAHSIRQVGEIEMHALPKLDASKGNFEVIT